MYADDTTLTFSASDTTTLESQINIELKQLNQWLLAGGTCYALGRIHLKCYLAVCHSFQ